MNKKLLQSINEFKLSDELVLYCDYYLKLEKQCIELFNNSSEFIGKFKELRRKGDIEEYKKLNNKYNFTAKLIAECKIKKYSIPCIISQLFHNDFVKFMFENKQLQTPTYCVSCKKFKEIVELFAKKHKLLTGCVYFSSRVLQFSLALDFYLKEDYKSNNDYNAAWYFKFDDENIDKYVITDIIPFSEFEEKFTSYLRLVERQAVNYENFRKITEEIREENIYSCFPYFSETGEIKL